MLPSDSSRMASQPTGRPFDNAATSDGWMACDEVLALLAVFAALLAARSAFSAAFTFTFQSPTTGYETQEHMAGR